MAARAGHEDLVKLLLDHDADLSITVNAPESETHGMNAWDSAVTHGYESIAYMISMKMFQNRKAEIMVPIYQDLNQLGLVEVKYAKREGMLQALQAKVAELAASSEQVTFDIVHAKFLEDYHKLLAEDKFQQYIKSTINDTELKLQ